MRAFQSLVAVSLLGLALACRTERIGATDGPPLPGDSRVVVSGDQTADRATLARLENEAKALARTDGCRAGECAAAPVGAKACGGPRYYLPYCRLTTDVPALNRKLEEIRAFERAFNERYGIVSTCEFAVPPEVAPVDGVCRAAGR